MKRMEQKKKWKRVMVLPSGREIPSALDENGEGPVKVRNLSEVPDGREQEAKTK